MADPADHRPAIPADLRRRVLVEAGHRCAIPACRHIEVELHHIIPWAEGRSHDYENLIALCPNCHHRADRGDIDRKSLRMYKVNLRAVHDKFSQLEIDALLALGNAEEGYFIPTLQPMMILFNRIAAAGLIEVRDTLDSNVRFSSWAGGVDTSPRYLFITAKGRDFIRAMGIREI